MPIIQNGAAAISQYSRFDEGSSLLMDYALHQAEGDVCFANVRRQVSLAGGEGGSQKLGVKALGMLFCQHPLCLNAEPR